MIDAYIVFLLVSQATMIFPSLNWWPHPVKWFKGLTTIDKFTFAVAIFTGLLFLATSVQVWAFIQSERAFLAIAKVEFDGGFAANKELTLSVSIKNSGKSTGFVDDFTTSVEFIAPDKTLPATPVYRKGDYVIAGPVLAGLNSFVYTEIHGVKGEAHLILTETDLQAINDGQLKMYVLGFISYHDDYCLTILGNRKTGFCYLYNSHVDTKFLSCRERAYTYAR